MGKNYAEVADSAYNQDAVSAAIDEHTAAKAQLAEAQHRLFEANRELVVQAVRIGAYHALSVNVRKLAGTRR
jgi:hypothetical protein